MSGKAVPATRLSADQRRLLILDVAGREFGAHGYGGASLRSIAAAAGVTTPVIYDHFRSKADLYATVAQEHADSLLARWAPPPQGSAEEIFHAIVDSIFGWVEAHPNGWRILFADVPADPVVAATVIGVQERAAAVLAAVFANLPELDHPGGLTRERANAAFAETAKSALNGLVAWWWHNPDVPRATVVALATDAIWGGLGRATSRESGGTG